MKKYPGRRIRFPNHPELLPINVQDRMQAGDYWKFEPHNLWLVCSPKGEIASIRDGTWTIVEHQDGTITVNPSIQFFNRDEKMTKGWHGYLTKGTWVEA